MKIATFTRWALLLGALFVLATAGMALAHGWGSGYGMRGGYGPGMMYGYGQGNAQIAPEKRAALEKLYAEHAKAMTPLRDELFAKQAELYALENRQNPDPKAVASLAKEISALRGKMFDLSQGFRSKVANETGWDMGPGMMYGPGSGMGRGMGRGMMYGMGPGAGGRNCPAW